MNVQATGIGKARGRAPEEAVTPKRYSRFHVIAVVLISLALYAAFVGIGIRNSLGGQFDQYLQPGAKYAAPDSLRAHGFSAKIYTPSESSGWDGQFYYYMANDPLILSDTPDHIDWPRYRYQRIGVPLIAYAASRLAGQDWVSPGMYFSVTLALMAIAAYALAMFAASAGAPPYWALLWSLGGASLYTVSFGFIDGAADALLILAMLAHLSKRKWSYVALMSLAILAREAYAIFPASIALATIVMDAANRRKDGDRLIPSLRELFLSTWLQVSPIALLLCWQAYIRIRLSAYPQIATDGLLGIPLLHALAYLFQSLSGQTSSTVISTGHTLTQELPKYSQAIGIFFFLALLLGIAGTAIAKWRRATEMSRSSIAILSCVSALCALYLFLGPIMFWEPVGYVKASSLLWAIYLVAILKSKSRLSKGIAIAAAGMVGFSGWTIYQRISHDIPEFQAHAPVWATSQPSCIRHPTATIEFESLTSAFPDNLITRLIVKRKGIAKFRVTNLGSTPFEPYQGPGTVNAGYQWFAADGTGPVADGARRPIPSALNQGNRAVVSIPVTYPSKPGKYLLRLTLVQEGCSWLYQLNPSIAADVPVEVR